MSCTDEADELPSSPPNMRKGLPSTISWVAVPCDCKKLFIAGFSKLFAEKLLLLDDKTLADGGSTEIDQ